MGRAERAAWHQAQKVLTRKLDLWAQVITYRTSNPGELYPELYELEERLPGDSGSSGFSIHPAAGPFMEISAAIERVQVPVVVRGIWVRQYGGAEEWGVTRTVRYCCPDCDEAAMRKVVNVWRRRLIEDLGLK